MVRLRLRLFVAKHMLCGIQYKCSHGAIAMTIQNPIQILPYRSNAHLYMHMCT